MAIRRINVGKQKIQNKVPSVLKPFKSLTMFKTIEDINTEADRLRKSGREVVVKITPTLKLMYR
jgi:hypothetical protein